MADRKLETEPQKQILFASRYAYMYYQSVSDAFKDYSLSFTQNGKQAINYLKRNKPSVVILSENLKELDTLKLCKAIRKSSRLTATKILLLVADHKNLDELSAERKANVDIILKQSQKPASFVTHIGKLLKASYAIEAKLNGLDIDDIIDKELRTADEDDVDIAKETTHLTPFPDAAENIYLFKDDEIVETVPENSNKQQTKHFSIEKESSVPQVVHPMMYQKPTPFALDQNRTIEQQAVPISPPSSPSNKPVYNHKLDSANTPQTHISQATKPQLPSYNSQPTVKASPQSEANYPQQSNYQNLKNVELGTQSHVPTNLYEVITDSSSSEFDSDTAQNPASDPLNFSSESLHNLQDKFDPNYLEAGQAKTIAIIEDNASIAFLEKSILERQGYNTIHISDAPQAREFVDTNFDMADLILLDLNLPGGSGFEILRRIRSFSRKPVIIVSGLKQSENIKRGLSLGAQDYLTKPMNPQELILRVSQHIKNFT